MVMDPSLGNSQSQIDPEDTGITAEYFEKDRRWLHNRIMPVFEVKKRRARLTRWLAADALPAVGSRMLRAPGGTGSEIPTQAPTPSEFFVNGGQLWARVPQAEIDDAEPGEKEQPFRVRDVIAAGFMNLEMEMRAIQYFKPGEALFPAGEIVAAGGNWQTYIPSPTNRVIGPDIKGIVAAYDLKFGVKPNFAIIDDVTDTFFMDQLLAERNTSISIASFRQGGDILPSSNGLVVDGMEILVPGARMEGTPLDAVYSPTRAWGTFPYMIIGFSPTLNGQRWNKVGNVYVAQADYREEGIVPFQVNRQIDPLFGKNRVHHMWWSFARAEQEIVEDMVMAIGPIY